MSTYLTIKNDENHPNLKTTMPKKKSKGIATGDTICFVVGSKDSAGVNNLRVYTGKICHSGYLWHVTPHGHSGICHHGERRMSRLLYTVANKSQMKASTKLRMTLSLHAPSICNKVTNDTFPSIAEDQII